MAKNKVKPEPVLTEEQKETVKMMDLFRDDMLAIESGEKDMTECLSATKHDPTVFKYLHYQFLFKVWSAGRDTGGFRASEAHVITMGKYQELREVAESLVKSALDDVRVHPCDEQDEQVKAQGLFGWHRKLWEILRNGN